MDDRRPGKRGGLADGAGGVDQAGECGGGDGEAIEDGLVPAGRVGGHQTGDGGVARVGHMVTAFGEVPDDPGVDRAETEVAGAIRIDCGEERGELRGRLVRRESETLGLPDEALADGAEVLPAEAGGKGLPGGSIPDDGGRALRGDAHTFDRPAGREHASGRLERGVGHGAWIELDETGHRGVRQHGDAVFVGDGSIGMHERRPHAGGADVDHEDAHGRAPFAASWAARQMAM